ncbi:hypothetical protein L6164_018826 [Bauhinia variegata]|uniref:Uncharacterized protein n=1 Tax=Bauhinia variegata TaxID=167791 RepID=A0ACB9NCM8_BAUVA|nr:hypothetical protein L6164_018826 [Bauhinia variegata]
MECRGGMEVIETVYGLFLQLKGNKMKRGRVESRCLNRAVCLRSGTGMGEHNIVSEEQASDMFVKMARNACGVRMRPGDSMLTSNQFSSRLQLILHDKLISTSFSSFFVAQSMQDAQFCREE